MMERSNLKGVQRKGKQIFSLRRKLKQDPDDEGDVVQMWHSGWFFYSELDRKYSIVGAHVIWALYMVVLGIRSRSINNH